MNKVRTSQIPTASHSDDSAIDLKKLYERPSYFLVTEFHDLEISPSATGLCVGYEDGNWRTEQLVNHAIEWLPEFALRTGEYLDTTNANVVERLRRSVSSSSKHFDILPHGARIGIRN